MTRAAFKHLRERAASKVFVADRASFVRLSNFWRRRYGWMAHAPVVKRGQKR